MAKETRSFPETDTAAPTSRNGTAPSTPDELSPSIAVAHQNGHTLKHEPSGSTKVEPHTYGKGVAQKNGKGHAKAAPLPPGFLESELQLHKKKLKSAEDTIDTHRQEIASLKRQLAEAAAESKELHDINASLESACRAAHQAQKSIVPRLGAPAGTYWWCLVGASVLSITSVVVLAAAKSTLQSR